jgi:invasion protein IalB
MTVTKGNWLLPAAVLVLVAASSAIAAPVQQTEMPDKRNASSWVKLCTQKGEGEEKQICLIKYEELDTRTGSVLLTAAVRTVEGTPGQQLLISVPSVYTLVIPAGLQARVDEDPPVALTFAVCRGSGCQAETDLSKEMLQTMMSGKTLRVAAMNMEQKTMAFPIPLTGFAKTWKGPPADMAKYQAARQHMLEYARAAAAREQAGGGQAGGDAGSSATPGASSVVPKSAPAPAP